MFPAGDVPDQAAVKKPAGMRKAGSSLRAMQAILAQNGFEIGNVAIDRILKRHSGRE